MGKYKIPMRTLTYWEMLVLGLNPEAVERFIEERAKRKAA